MNDDSKGLAIVISRASNGGFAILTRETFQKGGFETLYAGCSTPEETAGLILKNAVGTDRNQAEQLRWRKPRKVQ